jgi:hypothetical protein
MPRLLRIPSTRQLPQGVGRNFMELLDQYYRDAGRPTLAEVSDQVLAGDYAGTASRETIRRTLNGAVPTRWTTAEAIFLALCELAQVDPEGDAWDADLYDQPPTRRERCRQLWNEAIDEAPAPVRVVERTAGNPWASGPSSPPF